MRTEQSSASAMVKQESRHSSQTETEENSNSRQILLEWAGRQSYGGGIAFNRVAADVEPQTGPIYDPMATEKEDEVKSTKEEETSVAPVVENNLLGVRKKLLIPAEEALDSARTTAELIMKDAMDALQRTKQRLMEILHLHQSTSQAPPPAADSGSKINSEAVSADEADSEGREKIPTAEVAHIFSEPTMGIIFPFHQQPEAMAVVVQSRL